MSANTTGAAITITYAAPYGNYEVPDLMALPTASLGFLASAGLAHQLGNVVASDVVAWIKQEIRGEDKKREVTTAEVKAYREANVDAVAAKSKEFRDAEWADLLAGDVSRRAGGPRAPVLSAFDLMLRDIAEEEIAARLVKEGILEEKNGRAVVPGTNRLPRNGGKEPDQLVSIGGEGLTMAQLVERRVASPKFRPALEREANKRLEAKAKHAAKAAAGDSLMDDLA